MSIVKSLDPVFGLDQEAIKAAKQWRFAPGKRQGQPVAVLVSIELTFTLRGVQEPQALTTAGRDGHPRGPLVHAGAWILLLVGLLLFLFLGDAPEHTRFWDVLFDAGHTPLFGLVAVSYTHLRAHETRH